MHVLCWHVPLHSRAPGAPGLAHSALRITPKRLQYAAIALWHMHALPCRLGASTAAFACRALLLSGGLGGGMHANQPMRRSKKNHHLPFYLITAAHWDKPCPSRLAIAAGWHKHGQHGRHGLLHFVALARCMHEHDSC